MKNTVLKVLVIASALSPLTAFAQAGKAAPTTATYIMKEEIDKILATEQSQRTRRSLISATRTSLSELFIEAR